MGARIKIITGFTPIPNHPRPRQKYVELGEKLREVEGAKECFGFPLDGCWLYQYLRCKHPKTPTHAVADNPKKNTLAYHIVQHQKVETMVASAMNDAETDVFVWIDFGIFSIPGMSVNVIEDFLHRAKNEKGISIPGCWPRGIVSHDDVCWRFCGGVIVCHRDFLVPLDMEIKEEAAHYLKQHNHITFEVHTWARVEQKDRLPIGWYPADHNASMFTGYPQTTWAQ
jgi:hypothetical protein